MLRHMRKNVKVIMAVVIFLFVVSCFAGYGLYIRGGGRRNGEARDYPVAEAGGAKIMRSDLERAAINLAEKYGNREITSGDVQRIRKAALDSIVIASELKKEIKNRDITPSKDEVDAEYIKIMDSYPTREEFFVFMDRNGLKEADLKKDIEQQLAQRKLTESLNEGIDATDKEAEAFYDVAKNFLYTIPAGVKVNLATFRNRESAEKARQALTQGTSWDKAMLDNKDSVVNSTPYNKPELVTEQMMAGAFAVLKDYPMNEVTPVTDITSSDSYIAIKRSKEDSRTLPFDEVSADIKATIKSQKLMTKQNEFYNMLLSRADVKILDESIFPVKESEVTSADAISGDER